MTMLELNKPVGAARGTLQELVYQQLKAALMAGEFQPGQQLTVRAISESMNTSAMPAREAVRRLAAERALEILPNGQVRVRLMTADQRGQLRQIRAALEGMAARLAAAKISKEEIKALEAINKAMGEEFARRNAHAALIENQRFHFTIYRAAGADVLLDTIELLWMQYGPFLRLYVEHFIREYPEARKRNMSPHNAMIAALRRRDPDAAERAIRTEILEVTEFMPMKDENGPEDSLSERVNRRAALTAMRIASGK